MKNYIAPEIDIKALEKNVVMADSGLDTDVDMGEDDD